MYYSICNIFLFRKTFVIQILPSVPLPSDKMYFHYITHFKFSFSRIVWVGLPRIDFVKRQFLYDWLLEESV